MVIHFQCGIKLYFLLKAYFELDLQVNCVILHTVLICISVKNSRKEQYIFKY